MSDKTLETRMAVLLTTLQWIKSEAGQYADGAPDAHYLAKEMARFEQIAGEALAKFQRLHQGDKP